MEVVRKFFASMALMGSLLLLLALTLAIATFIENDFGTNAANALVYKTWWFELIFVVLAINLFLNIYHYKMWSVKKLPVLLFHLAFFVIIVGAGITRYFSYEGSMHIREGEASSEILSSETYIHLTATDGHYPIKTQSEVLFSEISKDAYHEKIKVNKREFELKSVDYVPNALYRPAPVDNGEPIFTLVVAQSSGREERYLKKGEFVELNGVKIGFKALERVDIELTVENSTPIIKSSLPTSFMTMQTQTNTALTIDSASQMYQNVLYSCMEAKFVLSAFIPSGALLPVKMGRTSETQFPDAVIIQIKEGDKSKILAVTGVKGVLGKPVSIDFDGIKFNISLGSKLIHIPFNLYLRDFQIERYPGSHSPSSFASEVTLKDERNGETFDKRIFMNNILNYGGYRFYQSSYDTDEQGTVLSVNHDYAGTIITYFGYLLLAISMIWALISKNTRFRSLLNKCRDIAKSKREMTLILTLFLSIGFINAEDIKPPHPISSEIADQFGTLWVQDNGGRVKPLNTMNNEITRKLVKHNSFKGYSADQLMLSFLIDAHFWQNEKLITVSSPELIDILKLDGKKASFKDFLTVEGGYKLQNIVEEAYRKKAAERNKTDQDAIKIDEQINIFYLAQTGGFLKLFPNPQKHDAPWLLPGTTPVEWDKTDSLIVNALTNLYLDAVLKNDVAKASEYLGGIKKFQNQHGSEILPTNTHLKVEIAYNNSNIFLWLAVVFFGIGIILLILQFITLLIPKYQFGIVNQIGFYALVFFFIIQTLGMATRWYLSGHAPWSNGYESMLYIAWSTTLAGLLFYKRSTISLSASALFSGILLMVAHLSWMNPEITNLVPVLKSYWLTIHVSIIVASYGFLSLGAFIGFINLILIGLKSKHNHLRLNLTVEELTAIAEMTMTIGLYMLAIGAFLGGVWANESWGRYWGWDPKETWSIITVFIYTFILHMRFIPGLKDNKVFNFAAVLGFAAVVMTYLGVNYYLAGMHSYAKGDPVPVPTFVYYTVATVFIVSFYAFYNEGKVEKELKD